MSVVHRLLATTTTLLLAAGLVAAGGASARAEQVEREITITGREPQENTFLVKGKISPSTGKPVNAVLEVKHCKKDKDCGAPWRVFETFKTKDTGRYSERVKGPRKGHQRVYYRVSTEENDSFLSAVSPEIYIYRIS